MLAAVSRISGMALWDQSAPAVLAVAHSGRHGLDERQPLPADPGSRLRRRAAGRLARLLHTQATLLRTEGDSSVLAAAIGTDIKGKASLPMYGLGIGLSFADRWLGIAVYIAMALMWLMPDRASNPRLPERIRTPAASHPDDAPAWGRCDDR
jgi:hypothetical protein